MGKSVTLISECEGKKSQDQFNQAGKPTAPPGSRNTPGSQSEHGPGYSARCTLKI